MLGYGLVNQSIHKFSIENIIISFLNRFSVVTPHYICGAKVLLSKDIIKTTKNAVEYLTNDKISDNEKLFDDLYNLFLEDEYYLTRYGLGFPDGSDLELDYQKQLYKYVLSSNLIQNKDYKFNENSTDVLIEEGKFYLKNVFVEIFKKFVVDITIKYSKDANIVAAISAKQNNLFLNYNLSTGIYTIKDDLKEGVLDYILSKYEKNIKKATPEQSSTIHKFYYDYTYYDVREFYIEILNKQMTVLDGRKVI